MSEYETQEQGDKPEVDISEVPIIQENGSEDLIIETQDRELREDHSEVGGDDKSKTGDKTRSKRCSDVGSRATSHGNSKMTSRANSRGTSRGTSRGSRRSTRAKSGKRPISAPYTVDITYNMYGFNQRVEGGASNAEAAFMNVSQQPLLGDDETNGVQAYLHACACLDITPRGKVLEQCRDAVEHVDFSGCLLGPRGVQALTPVLTGKATQIRTLSFADTQLLSTGVALLADLLGNANMPGLTSLDLSNNGLDYNAELRLEQDFLLPGLPKASLDFAREYRKNLLLKREQERLDAENPPDEKEKKDKKDGEDQWAPRPTALLMMGRSLTRPYDPPIAEKGGSKAPTVPELQPLDAQEPLSQKLASLGLKGVDRVGSAIANIIGMHQNLKELNLSNNKISNQTLQLILQEPRAQQLEYLGLSGCGINGLGLQAIIQCAQAGTLKKLDLSNNRLTERDIAQIGVFMCSGGGGIDELLLSGNAVGDVGGALLLSCMNGAAQFPKKKKVVDDKKQEAKGAPAGAAKPTLQTMAENRQKELDTKLGNLGSFEEALAVKFEGILGTAPPGQGGRLPVKVDLRRCGLGQLSAAALVALLRQVSDIGELDLSQNNFGQLEFFGILKAINGRKGKKQKLIRITSTRLFQSMLAQIAGQEEADKLPEILEAIKDVEGVELLL